MPLFTTAVYKTPPVNIDVTGNSTSPFAGGNYGLYALDPFPANLSIDSLGVSVNTVNATTWTFRASVGGTPEGPTVSLLAGGLTISGPIAATISRPESVGELSPKVLRIRAEDAVFQGVRLVTSYQFASPYSDWSALVNGFTLGNFGTVVGPDAYYPVHGNVINILEAPVRIRWPIPGTFQHFLVVRNTNSPSGGPTFRYRLRINGATVIEMVESAISSQVGVTFNDSATAPILADDLINFAAHSDGPLSTSNRSSVQFAIGFLPS